MADNELGILLRLWGISTRQLPPLDATADDIAPLMLALLQEAVAFVDTVDDSTAGSLWREVRATKTYRGRAIGRTAADADADAGQHQHQHQTDSSVAVEMLNRIVPSDALRRVLDREQDKSHKSHKSHDATGDTGTAEAEATARLRRLHNPRALVRESWACRRSRHADVAAGGTASWAEFRTAMMDEHAATEFAMTPTVLACHEAVVWPAAATALQDTEEGGRRWSHFTLAVQETRHRIANAFMADRVFPVLRMTCATVGGGSSTTGVQGTPTSTMAGGGDQGGQDQGGQDHNTKDLLPEFLVVSVPIDDFATATMRGTADPDDPDSNRPALLCQLPGVKVAPYVSVERFRLLPKDERDMRRDSRGTHTVEWVMATASNAGGHIPRWTQELFVYGEIAKDVPLFLQWIARMRQQDEVEAVAAAVAPLTVGGADAEDAAATTTTVTQT